MNDSTTILVPLDLSDCSAEVVAKAAELAELNEASLVLAHVVQPPAGVAPGAPLRPEGAAEPTDAAHYLAQEARPWLEQQVEQLRGRGLDAGFRITVGRPVEAIQALADKLGAELIVMGTHGRTGISRLVLGSVAEAVSRRASCPVVTVRSQHHSGCDARSCSWCDKHISQAARAVAAEADG